MYAIVSAVRNHPVRNETARLLLYLMCNEGLYFFALEYIYIVEGSI